MLIKELPAALYKPDEHLAMHELNQPLPGVFPQDVFIASAYELGNVCHYVRYVSNKISIADITAGGGLVVSGEFNGCWMAKFTLGGNVYACHIAMEMSGVKLLKTFLDFVDRQQANVLALFKPVALAPLGYENVSNSCIGVITPRNRKIYINIERGTFRAYEPREIISGNAPMIMADGTGKEGEYVEVDIDKNIDLLSI